MLYVKILLMIRPLLERGFCLAGEFLLTSYRPAAAPAARVVSLLTRQSGRRGHMERR